MPVKKLTSHFGEDFSNLQFAIWGLSFKPNTDDLRESPSLEIIPRLRKLGVKINAHDPAFNKEFIKIKAFDKVKWYSNVLEAIKNADLLVIHTEWNEYRGLDLLKVKKELKNPIILDLRNIFNLDDMKKFNIKYYGIGFKS